MLLITMFGAHILSIILPLLTTNIFAVMLPPVFIAAMNFIFLNTFSAQYIIGIKLSFATDQYGQDIYNIICILWPLNLLYIYGYKKIDNLKLFLALINASVLCGACTCFSADIMTAFCCYEILTLLTTFLVGFRYTDHHGAAYYFKALAIPSLLFAFPAVIAKSYKYFEGPWVNIFIALGFAKSALIPMHTWLPRAMVAHYPVSAMLHAVVVVNVGVVCMLKFYQASQYHQVVFYLGLIGAYYSSAMAIKAPKLKSTLAYSTVAQLNFIICTLSPHTTSYLTCSNFSKISLFFVAGIIYHQISTDQLAAIRGYGRKNLAVGLLCAFSCFSVICGNKSEMVAMAGRNDLETFALNFLTILSVIYLGKIVVCLFAGPRPNDTKDLEAVGTALESSYMQQPPLKMMLALCATTSLAVVQLF